MLKELFPDWTDADLVLALDESGGDLETTIEKISEGESLHRNVSHGFALHQSPRGIAWWHPLLLN